MENKERCKKYRLKNIDSIRTKERIRDRTPKRRNRLKLNGNIKEYNRQYMKKYSQIPQVKIKSNIIILNILILNLHKV